MIRFRAGFIIMISLCILLGGCQRRHNTDTALNLTQKLSIDCLYRDNRLQRTYTDSDTIDVILKYLHKLSPTIQIPQQPEQVDGDHCNITLYLSDGTTRSYDLQGKEYLRKDQGAWYPVDPQKANIIYHLVNHIESDKKAAHQQEALVCSYFLQCGGHNSLYSMHTIFRFVKDQ